MCRRVQTSSANKPSGRPGMEASVGPGRNQSSSASLGFCVRVSGAIVTVETRGLSLLEQLSLGGEWEEAEYKGSLVSWKLSQGSGEVGHYAHD